MHQARLFSIIALIVLFVSLTFFPLSHSKGQFSVLEVTIDAAISPAQDELLKEALRSCEEQGGSLLLIVLDTPGGLGESMRSMVSTILNSDIPVAVWVGPKGARAASAGVFLVAASTMAGMAPMATIGAASPVGLGGGDISKTMSKKITNDMSSLVKGVAQSRGRNASWYNKAVEESVSITALEALELKVVEFVAESPRAFMLQVGEKGFDFKDSLIKFDSGQLEIIRHDPGFRYEILSWLLHPQIAYLFLMGGMLGLFIEVTHPGTVFPGVFGGLCFLLGLYALSVLPTNIAGVLLVLFSLVLFILEIKVISYGMLSVAAIVSLFVGSLILFKDEYGSIQIPFTLILLPVMFLSACIVAILYLVVRSQKRNITSGGEGMVGLTGKVISWEGNSGQILVRGEIWAAKGAIKHFTPSRGSRVKIISLTGLTLNIEPDS